MTQTMAATAEVQQGAADEGWGHFTEPSGLNRPTSGPPMMVAAVSDSQATTSILKTGKIEASSTQTSASSLASHASSRNDNGHHISCPDFGSLRSARYRVSSSGITFSEAKGEIWKERLRGPLLKRGFRHRKQWVARWVVISGRMLTYFVRPQDETEDHRNARGSLELTGETVVSYEEDDSVFGFMIFPRGDKRRGQQQSERNGENSPTSPSSVDLMPIARHDDHAIHSAVVEEENEDEETNGGDGDGASFLSCGTSFASLRKRKQSMSQRKSSSNSNSSWWSSLFGLDKQIQMSEEVWCFRARSASERETWVRAIQRLVALIRRVEMAPTLVGVGSIDYHYELKHDIGVGRFGTVKLAVARATGNIFAVKVLNRAKFSSSPEASMALNMEIRVIKKVTRMHDHPNICKTYHSFADNFLVFLVMEHLGGGSLMDRIRKKGHYQECEASNVVFQIASALKELHSSGIVLCDINPSNLLYERPDNETIKVVEFGRALIMPGPAFASQTRHQQAQQQQQDASHQQQNGGGAGEEAGPRRKRHPHSVLSSFVTIQAIVGQPGYIAPEILSHKQYSTACDIYALGCVAFTMLTGASTLLGADPARPPPRTALDQVLLDAKLSMEARDLIGGMTHPDRSKRLTASQVLEHPWIVSPTRGGPVSVEQQEASPALLFNSRTAIVPSHMSLAARPPSLLSKEVREARRLRLIKGVRVVQFCVRMMRVARSGKEVIKAQPPPPLMFSVVDSRRSTETSSGVSQLELRNQWLTLDGYAQRVRSENRLDELSPIFKSHSGHIRASSSASGFTAVGISSSVAGQLSELGVDSAESRETIRPPGPFLTALEAHLQAEAGISNSSSSDQEEDENSKDENTEEEEEEMTERITDNSVASNPQGASRYPRRPPITTTSSSTKMMANHQVGGNSSRPITAQKKPLIEPGVVMMDGEEEEEEAMSPKTAREQGLRAYAEMERESQNVDG